MLCGTVLSDDNAGVAKPGPIDADVFRRRAQGAVLSGLARGDDTFEVLAAVASTHVPAGLAPDVALLEFTVTTLDLAMPPHAEPLTYNGLRERYLPEVNVPGRVEHRNSQHALYAAACIRGGLQPDLSNDAGWWQTPCGSTPSSPSSSTAAQRPSGWQCQWRTSHDGSPLRTASSSPRDPSVVTRPSGS